MDDIFVIIVGTILEWKVESCAFSLHSLTKVTTNVIKAGVKVETDSEDLVGGDVTYLESSDKMTADIRFIAEPIY